MMEDHKCLLKDSLVGVVMEICKTLGVLEWACHMGLSVGWIHVELWWVLKREWWARVLLVKKKVHDCLMCRGLGLGYLGYCMDEGFVDL